MSDSDTINPNFPESASGQIPTEEPELNHTDKITGVLSEPKSTFEKIAKFPLKNIDWLLPLVLSIIVFSAAYFIKMADPEIKLQVKQQQEKAVDKLVADKVLTREQADNQLKMADSPLASIFAAIGFIIFGFIIFFVMCGIYYLLVKLIAKGDGKFKSVMVSYSLISYIGIIQVIFAAILSVFLKRMVNDTSLAALLNSDRLTYPGWLFAKIDPFTIWIAIVLSLGLAKMFKSESSGKYFAIVFGVWIIGSLILLELAKVSPFFRGFAGAQ